MNEHFLKINAIILQLEGETLAALEDSCISYGVTTLARCGQYDLNMGHSNFSSGKFLFEFNDGTFSVTVLIGKLSSRWLPN